MYTDWGRGKLLAGYVLAILTMGLPQYHLLAQSTISTGSIMDTVTDASGAAVQGVRVVITRRSTAQVVTVTTNSVGAYNSGALIPGDYSVQLSVAGFRMVSSSATVLVGNVATMNGTFGEGFSSTQG